MFTRDNVQDIYGLTPMQEGMLVEHARDPQSAAYVEQFDFTMEGPLDLAALGKSFAAVTAKYDALRTMFSFRKTDRPRQVVLRNRTPTIESMDLAGFDEGAAQVEVNRFKQADRDRSFDISSDPLIRLTVLSLSARHHRMVMTFHHIILDGWCFGPLFEDLFSFYDRFRAKPDAVIAEREAQPYGEYIRWLGQQDWSRARAYWEDYLDGYEVPAGAPYFDVGSEGPARDAQHEVRIGKALTARLTDSARTHRVTVNGLFQAAWGVLLQKYNDTEDVAFGNVVSGRPAELPGVERMVGLFINTQPLRVTAKREEPFADVARRVHRNVIASSAYEYYPLSAVQAASPLKNRLINHVVTFENFPISEQMRLLTANSQDLRVTDLRVFQAAKFDFHLIVFPGEDMGLSFVYNENHYAAETIECLARSLVHLLQSVAECPTEPIERLTICARSDARRILHEFNATQRDYPIDRSVVGLFADIVATRPDATALCETGRSLSYAELRAGASELAGRLRDAGVRPGDTVGLLAPRSAEMVIGMLATLYCGAAYLPLEVEASDERLRFMMQDASARILCVHSDCRGRAPDGVGVIELQVPDSPEPARSLVPVTVAPESPAYVMYTSGSTGRPKACAITHRSIVRLVRDTDYVEFGPHQRMLHAGSPAFDASTFEVWGALLNGGALCVVDTATLLDPRLLREALQRFRITVLFLTSGLFNRLCEADATMFRTVSYLVVGGDVLSPSHIERGRSANPGLVIVNGYGPTENTTFSTSYTVTGPHDTRIPIGKPIANSTAYILDAAGALLPPGAYGELCVGGDGVALGYLNQPELTRRKFVADTFRPGGRLYRTGDIVRWLPDGTIDLKGRNDSQVKIRGFRVELGEIEAALAAHPAISDVAVVPHDGPGGKRLHTFYVGNADITPADLGAFLSSLPSYMVPASCTRLDRMPLTVNGKLDRRALPIAQSLAQRPAETRAEPLNVVERCIVDIWREVLGTENISVHGNFFEVGASSLDLIAVNNRLTEAFGREIPLAILFEYTSIARLADYIAADQVVDEDHATREAIDLDEAKNTLVRTTHLMKNMEEA